MLGPRNQVKEWLDELWLVCCVTVTHKDKLTGILLTKGEVSNMSLPLAPGLHPPLLLPGRDELRLPENWSNGNGGVKPCISMGTISEYL